MKHTVFLLNDSFPPMIDGVANTVVNYGRQIEAHHGHAVVLTPRVPGITEESYRENYPFPVIPYDDLPIDTRGMIGYMAGNPFSLGADMLRRLKAEAEKGGGAVLAHSHCPVASSILAREMRGALGGIPLVLTYHTKFDIDIKKAIRGKLLQDGAIRALANNILAFDEVWAVSEGAKQNLLELVDMAGQDASELDRDDRLIVMPNGVDVPRGRVSDAAIAEAVKGYDLPEDVPMLLFVGRMMWYKGLDVILDALALLRQRGAAFRMVFVGGGGDEAEVRERAAALGLTDVCFFTGSISDRETIRAWYSRADAFLFPSTYDTNGLVVREAAASATATVMVAGSCAAEGVTDGRNGFLIEQTAESLAAKLTAICADREIMRRVGENAQRELYLSWEDAVAHANERYGFVIDKYQRGGYPTHDRPTDDLLRWRGEMAKAFSGIRDVGSSVLDTLEESGERLKANVRSKAQPLLDGIESAKEQMEIISDKFLQ